MLRNVILALLYFTHVARALSVRGHELTYENRTHHGRVLTTNARTIWYVNSGSDPPPGCVTQHEAIGPGVYLARGDASASFPRGVWTPQMKYDPAMRTTAPPQFPVFGVQVRTDSTFFEFHDCDTSPAGRGRFYVSCAAPQLEALAEDDRVLWISSIPVLSLHSYTAARVMFGDANAREYNGSTVTVVVSDTGVDYKHCSVYEGSAPPLGSISWIRQKILGILSAIGDYGVTEGSHGAAMVSILAGYACDDAEGVASQAKVVFIDSSTGNSRIYIPWNFEDVITESQAWVHSMSWGEGPGGGYSDTQSRIDAMAYADRFQTHVSAAGNDGPSGVTSSTHKNGLTVAACLNTANDYYPEFSSTQRTQQPELYSHTSQAYFSSRGPAASGAIGIHTCAHGYRVQQAYANPTYPVNHASYNKGSGTSQAAATASGGVAKLHDRHYKLYGSRAPSALIEAQVMVHGDKSVRIVAPTGNALYTITGIDIYGFGVPTYDWDRWTDMIDASVTGSTRKAFCYENLDTETYRMMLRWTDVAGSEGSSAPIINDLDMIVTGSLGVTKVLDDERNTFEYTDAWPAQHTRLIVMAYNGITTFGTQHFSIHMRAKTRNATCASAVLPSEYSACTEPGAVRYVSSWLGATACDYRVCPSNTCGADCARTCTSTTCDLPSNGGSGKRDNVGTCRPVSCLEYTFVTDTVCKCKMGTARTCANGQVASCLDSGAFGECPASTLASVSSGSQAAASSARVHIVASYAVTVFILALCIGVS